MRLSFRQDRPREGAGRLKARGPPPPWMIPGIEEQERQRKGPRPLEEPVRPEIPLERPRTPLIVPIIPEPREDQKGERGVVIIDL